MKPGLWSKSSIGRDSPKISQFPSAPFSHCARGQRIDATEWRMKETEKNEIRPNNEDDRQKNDANEGNFFFVEAGIEISCSLSPRQNGERGFVLNLP